MTAIIIMAALATAILAILLPQIAQGTKPENLDDIIDRWARIRNIPSPLVRAMIRQESNFKVDAINKNDPGHGAIGLMQIVVKPGTHNDVLDDFNEASGMRYTLSDMYVADKNIEVGTWYLAKLIKKYDINRGVEMYNVGEYGYIKLGRRNERYRARVMSFYSNYQAA